jgi:hypothetical protein
MTEIFFYENQYDDWFIVEINGVMVAWEPLPQNSKRLSGLWGYWNLRSAETIYGVDVASTSSGIAPVKSGHSKNPTRD